MCGSGYNKPVVGQFVWYCRVSSIYSIFLKQNNFGHDVDDSVARGDVDINNFWTCIIGIT